MEKFIVESEVEVIEILRKELEERSNAALRETGCFRVGLSGGSVLNYLCEAIPRVNTDLSKWKFYFCDERYVHFNDPDSTFGCYKKTMLPSTSLKEEQFAPLNLDLPLEECASDYEQRIRRDFNLVGSKEIPRFDVLLLGMGPDGHTCSLFPGHNLLQERSKLIAAISDSPKPPPKRITMTFTLLNNAKCCIFAMCGAGKAEMVKRVFVNREDLPAGMVAPTNGQLLCIFDKAAAADVPKQ